MKCEKCGGGMIIDRYRYTRHIAGYEKILRVECKDCGKRVTRKEEMKVCPIDLEVGGISKVYEV